MDFKRRVLSGFTLPFAGLIADAMTLGWTCRYPGLYADKLLLIVIGIVFVWQLRERLRRSSLLTARFVSSLEHGDLTQAFRTSGQDAGLDRLGQVFEGAIQRLRTDRVESNAETRFAGVLVDETPTPLLLIDDRDVVHLANKAARRLFKEADGRTIKAYERYGRDFSQALATARPGERRTCRVHWNGIPQRATLAMALADRRGAAWRIASVQIIQRELDALEMATQSNLVRVLTHEIMNSLTPITSLAASAMRLLEEAGANNRVALEDARMAVGALSRRAAAISTFVEAYRNFSEAPNIRTRAFAVEPWLAELEGAFKAMPQAAGIAVEVRLSSSALTMSGDPELLGQVMLNLLKNAGQACQGVLRPAVTVDVEANDTTRTVVSVSDNGPGIPPALHDEVFLPFFTTKPDGSGVGLSFAKQIVLLHGGLIGIAEPRLGGATVQVLL